MAVGCVTPRYTVEIQDYVLLPNGKEILGKEKGLTAFIFENDPTKQPFRQYVSDRYQVGVYTDVSYWVTIKGNRYKVFIYENDELQKYFDMSQFMVTRVETEPNIVGSDVKFLGMSIIDAANNDCLTDDSLFRNIAINYLKELKDEYLKS